MLLDYPRKVFGEPEDDDSDIAVERPQQTYQWSSKQPKDGGRLKYHVLRSRISWIGA